jgi:spore germination protein YaaH
LYSADSTNAAAAVAQAAIQQAQAAKHYNKHDTPKATETKVTTTSPTTDQPSTSTTSTEYAQYRKFIFIVDLFSFQLNFHNCIRHMNVHRFSVVTSTQPHLHP